VTSSTLPTGCAAKWGSPPLWGEACVAMAVALVSARPAEHFRISPGGYFHGMVAKAGELNLVRTI
jgi:replication initiation protein RepC